jgi:hypothetical protein
MNFWKITGTMLIGLPFVFFSLFSGPEEFSIFMSINVTLIPKIICFISSSWLVGWIVVCLFEYLTVALGWKE